MEDRWRVVVAATIVLALPLGGCKDIGQRNLLPVGTCVRVSDEGTATVSCAEPHTHRVIAIAGQAEACPRDTDMYAQPADPDDGLMTTCFQADAAAE
jgi:hypothetical protein